MDENRENQTPSENSSPEKNQSNQSNTNTASPVESDEIDITDIVKGIEKRLEKIEQHTSSEQNIKWLDQIKELVQKIPGFPVEGQVQQRNASPETPQVEIPGFEIKYIRKRGGRIVKRSVPVKNSERQEQAQK